MRAALICVVALGLVSQISAECANACSGHGVCRNSDQCDCFPNYVAADCSQRVCPYGLAWVDNPNGDLDHSGARAATSGSQLVTVYTFNDGPSIPTSAGGYIDVKNWETFNPAAQDQEGHFYSECSNKGLCDRSTGLCVCFDGYTGSSCQRTTCPNDCSGNGVCRTVEEIAAGDLPNSVAAGAGSFGAISAGLNKREVDNTGGHVFYEGVETATQYRLWDADMAQACVCDPGFSGPDCSQRECPRGDDPLTHRYGECPDNGNPAYTLATPCLSEVQIFNVHVGSSDNEVDWFHILFTDWTGKIWKTDDFLIGGASTVCADATLPLANTDSEVATAIKDALEGIPNGIIRDVTVGSPAAYGTVAQVYKVSITFNSNTGNVPLLEFVNSLDMQVNLPVCLDQSRDATVTLASEWSGNKELSTCSNRGVCDSTSGLCKCFKGYYGGDCSMQNALSQ